MPSGQESNQTYCTAPRACMTRPVATVSICIIYEILLFVYELKQQVTLYSASIRTQVKMTKHISGYVNLLTYATILKHPSQSQGFMQW